MTSGTYRAKGLRINKLVSRVLSKTSGCRPLSVDGVGLLILARMLNRSSRRVKRAKSHSGFGQPFDESVVLLHAVVQIQDMPEFCSFGKLFISFEVINCWRVSGILIHVNHSRHLSVRSAEYLTQEPLC